MSIAKNRFELYVLILIFALCTLISPSPVLAAKPRVWSTQTTTKTTTATKPSFSVKFRSDRRALNIGFYSLNTANSTTYELTYNGNGIDQGVFGSIYEKEGASASRLLLFGTCSKTVCRYHTNINNMQLKITSKLKTGKTLIKTYKIKV